MANRYRKKQEALVRRLNDQALQGQRKFQAEIAQAVDDYEEDPRVFLGIVAFPTEELTSAALNITSELRKVDPSHFFIPTSAMHFTIKNVRTISSPPEFTYSDVNALQQSLPQALGECAPFELTCDGFVYTPSSIGLAAYSTEEFLRCVQRLDTTLKGCGVADNKKYISDEVFFTNLTLVRFRHSRINLVMEAAQQMATFDLPVERVERVHLVSASLAFAPGHTTVHGAYGLARAGNRGNC